MFSAFLSSGFFLGWSLGANDASNVFGTAVGSRMIRFRTAAVYCSIFVILGAVISGAGASHTLGKLGAVNAIAGAFIVAFSAALSVYLMTIARFPVSTSQAIVGAIIGWNFFSDSVTDIGALSKIVSTWMLCPLLSGCFAIVIYLATSISIKRFRLHMFKLDSLTRYSLLLAGIFGSYALGANNIANVMGVFVPVAPFDSLHLFGLSLSPAQQLFFFGGVAIAIGVFTYSKRVMMTVGSGIFNLTPVAATVVVWSHSLVLFLFSSRSLEAWLQIHNLPAIPLVPVSSSQAIVGAVIGIGILKGGKGIKWKTVAGITSGWITTPIIAAIVCFVSLFFMQNVFQQQTFKPVEYKITKGAMDKVIEAHIPHVKLQKLMGEAYPNGRDFSRAIRNHTDLSRADIAKLINIAELFEVAIPNKSFNTFNSEKFNTNHYLALTSLEGRTFQHKWQIRDALAKVSEEFRYKVGQERWNNQVDELFQKIIDHLTF